MESSDITRPTLIERLGHREDAEAWALFVRLYSPQVFNYLRRCGLQEADAADVMQDVLRTVLRSVGGFVHDAARGSFRGWLIKVVKSRMWDHVSRQARDVAGSGDTSVRRAIEQIPDEDVSQQELSEWDQDWQRRVFDWAAEQVRDEFQEHTWQAFWMTRVENRDVADVAEELGMKVATVYVARGRVMARIQQKVREVGDDECCSLVTARPLTS